MSRPGPSRGVAGSANPYAEVVETLNSSDERVNESRPGDEAAVNESQSDDEGVENESLYAEEVESESPCDVVAANASRRGVEEASVSPSDLERHCGRRDAVVSWRLSGRGVKLSDGAQAVATQTGAYAVQAEKASVSPARACVEVNGPCSRSHEAEKDCGRRACEQVD